MPSAPHLPLDTSSISCPSPFLQGFQGSESDHAYSKIVETPYVSDSFETLTNHERPLFGSPPPWGLSSATTTSRNQYAVRGITPTFHIRIPYTKSTPYPSWWIPKKIGIPTFPATNIFRRESRHYPLSDGVHLEATLSIQSTCLSSTSHCPCTLPTIEFVSDFFPTIDIISRYLSGPLINGYRQWKGHVQLPIPHYPFAPFTTPRTTHDYYSDGIFIPIHSRSDFISG